MSLITDKECEIEQISSNPSLMKPKGTTNVTFLTIWAKGATGNVRQGEISAFSIGDFRAPQPKTYRNEFERPGGEQHSGYKERLCEKLSSLYKPAAPSTVPNWVTTSMFWA